MNDSSKRLKATAPLITLDNFKNYFDRTSKLKIINTQSFKNSKSNEAFWRVRIEKETFDIIKFTTPKRTRSFPMARMFEIITSSNKKVAIVPIIKDEGNQADFLGFETISLINIFGFYCIIAFYDDAELKKEKSTKITSQKLNFQDIIDNLEKIVNDQLSPSDWNKIQIREYERYLKKAKEGYLKIIKKLKLKEDELRSPKNIDSHLKKIKEKGLEGYISWKDRNKRVSQHSELHTIQPKEDILIDFESVPLDIYFENNFDIKTPIIFHTAIDEFFIDKGIFWFIEKKRRSKAGSDTKSNIIEGIFRDILYNNLIFDKKVKDKVKFAIGVTADEFNGVCFSACPNFYECYKNNFISCKINYLNRFNQKMDIFKDKIFKKAALHCFENNTVLFILGRNCLLTKNETLQIQKIILKISSQKSSDLESNVRFSKTLLDF